MLDEADVKNILGLSQREVEKKLLTEGYNELQKTQKRDVFHIALEIILEPMFLLLIASGTIYLLLGDVHEALILLSFVFVVIFITIYQERKTERALEALKNLSSPRALVVRDGQQRRISGREVVSDDIIIISEGDRVPADAVMLWGVNLSVDESLLTGESISVRKSVWNGKTKVERPGGEDLPFIYASTLVVQGRGVARVIAIGSNTEVGKIGKAIQRVKQEKTLLQKETKSIVKVMTIVGAILCTCVTVVYGFTRFDWLSGFLAGITLAMAILPEEFPVVLTIFLALGAWRISGKNVLTRRVPTVETLGSATVLCVDKTGTLTSNRMSIKKLCLKGSFYDVSGDKTNSLPERFHELIEYGILASQRDPFDPMERAFKELGEGCLYATEHLHGDWSLVHQYPLSPQLLALSHVWKSVDGEDYVIAAKGAPEAIAELCHLGGSQSEELESCVNSMANDGLRILGIAGAKFKEGCLPKEQHDIDFKFIGLVGLTDPIRPTVPKSIQECFEAGIRVVMITGDYTVTAKNIAKQIGLKSSEKIITGAELDEMSDVELSERIRETNIFARVVPEQKLRLVNALKANGEIVAMTGDGVNDAPALKSAHIGVAMGGRGTDVARESAALVLLDDDFSSIVDAIKMGRRIFDNIKKAMAYIIAVHVPIAGMSLIPVLFKMPLVFLPVHIVFMELIIDPACTVAFESETEEPNIMKRKPRDPTKPLFNRTMITLSLLQGMSVLIMVLAIFILALDYGEGEFKARTLAFTTLIVANLGLILTNRSWSISIIGMFKFPNKSVWWVLGGAVFFLGVVLYVPFMRDLFQFADLRMFEVLACLIAGIFSVLWFEIFKLFSNI